MQQEEQIDSEKIKSKMLLLQKFTLRVSISNNYMNERRKGEKNFEISTISSINCPERRSGTSSC